MSEEEPSSTSSARDDFGVMTGPVEDKRGKHPNSRKNLRGGNKRGTALMPRVLKDAILEAMERAGGAGGTVAYLAEQAVKNPGPFLGLVGKVLPLTLAGDPNNPIRHEHSASDRLRMVIAAIGSRAE